MDNVVLRTKGLTKSFGALKASDDVSLDLRVGEIHAIIGPNGAGKTTLIAQICGGLRPDAGRVELLGRDVTAMPTRARASLGLARTFQISALAMDATVLENALLGAIGAGARPWQFWRPVVSDKGLMDRANAALDRVGMADLAGMKTAELSHGQRRQLEVAVALTLSPRAFVMDEPMAGMGLEGSKRLTEFLSELRNEAPILLVEHDMDAVFALADRISVLVYGKIIATGSIDDIKRNPEVQAAYLGESV